MSDRSPGGSIRFLFASLIPDSRTSGMGKWSYNIATALAAGGHSAELWFADRFPSLRRGAQYAVVLGPAVLAGALAAARRRFDVAVVHEPSALGYAVLRKAAPDLPPLIVMCHNVESHTYQTLVRATAHGWATVGWRNRLSRQCLRRPFSDGAIRLGDGVVCLSETDRRYIIRALRRPPAAVSLMVNGVGPAFRRNGPPGGSGVLFVGGWLEVKGRRLLPAIWRRVRAERPDARLTLAGTGCGPEVLHEFAPDDRPSVTVAEGVTSDEAMADLYAAHAVLLSPSLSEGSPLSVVEALAVGVPVVAARVGGIPDIITHGRDGLLFPSADPVAGAEAVLSVLRQPALAAALTAGGRARADELTWASAAAVLEGAARSVLAYR